MQTDQSRRILHIDMDAFYASVEERDQPELKKRPIAVGGQSKRGVLTTANYMARQYGVKSAMPNFKALQLCPHLLILPARFEVYKEASQQIRAIFKDYTSAIEPLSLDEAFLDVSDPAQQGQTPTGLAREIKQRIRDELHLTASAGVSFNKFLAKLASGYRKPDGLFVIRPHEALDFLSGLEVRRFFGIGPVTARKLEQKGIVKGSDIQALNAQEAVALLGHYGYEIWKLAQGIDNRPVSRGGRRKSLSIETTFFEDVIDKERLQIEIRKLAQGLHQRATKASFTSGTLVLKAKDNRFQNRTRSLTQAADFLSEKEIIQGAFVLLDRLKLERPLRLLGLGLAKSDAQFRRSSQLDLPLIYD